MKKIKTVSLILLVFLSIVLFLVKLNNLKAEYPVQDRFMNIGACYCECDHSWNHVGFDCSYAGNDCYASSYCFCDGQYQQ